VMSAHCLYATARLKVTRIRVADVEPNKE